ncbi:hypothetical protein HDK90DRAFT_495264 [Phyllosticta capitalensis]|uniref:Transmembrane protein n=1 Tax=Phyllosticta capitalensis TaxID=121624 RepID=A0ABR1YEW1_9PEZI
MYSTRPKLSSFSKHPSRLLSRAVAASRPCIQSIYLATRGLHVVLCVCVCVLAWFECSALCARAPLGLFVRPSVRPSRRMCFFPQSCFHASSYTSGVLIQSHVPANRSVGSVHHVHTSLSLFTCPAPRCSAAQRSAAQPDRLPGREAVVDPQRKRQ